MDKINAIKGEIERIIGVNAKLTRRKKTKEDIEKETFMSVMTELEKKLIQSYLLKKDHQINFDQYDEPLYSVIDTLMLSLYGDKAFSLISAYLYNRNEKGQFILKNDQEEIIISNLEILWSFVEKMKTH